MSRGSERRGSGRRAARLSSSRARSTATSTGRRSTAGRSAARKATDRQAKTKRPDDHKRLLVLLGAFALAGVLFIGVLVDLQAVRPEEYIEVGDRQRNRESELAGYRGSIVDRSGFVFAASATGRSIEADPSLIVDPAAVAAQLAPALGIDAAVVADLLEADWEGDRWNVIATSIDDDTQLAVRELLDADDDGLLTGITIREDEERVYPAGLLALGVVGRVNTDLLGIYGMELLWNGAMVGQDGYERTERGLFGSITGGLYERQDAIEGADVALTLDYRIQYVTEQTLIEHCEQSGSASANAVVSDPRSGEILAMATVLRSEDGSCVVPIYNGTLVTAYEPGSVIKAITAAGVIEDAGWSADTLIDVPSVIEFEDYDFHEHDPDFVPAPYPIRQIITRSMNNGTIRLAQELGHERLWAYLDAFGFGRYSGIGWDKETRGRLRDWTDWYDSDLGSISFGQGVSVNTVQLNAAYNAIANDGLYIQPRLIRSVTAADGNDLALEPQETRSVVSAETSAEVIDMLTSVVHSENGTGQLAAVPGYTVAGKTGTAWKVLTEGEGKGTYGEAGAREYVVSFAGFLPAEDPHLSITVVFDEPTENTTAGLVAAPAFADIAQYAVRILGIPPGEAVEVPAGRVHGTPAPAPTPVSIGAGGENTAADNTAAENTAADDTAAESAADETGATG